MRELKPDEKLLKSAGLRRARPELWVRGDAGEVMSRIAAADIVISDLDECMYPYITQAEAAVIFVRRIVRTPFEDGHLELIPNLLPNMAALLWRKFYQEVTGDIQNSRLIRAFERFARGVPLEYFTDAAEEFKGNYFRGAPDAFRVFSGRGVPVGVISLGLDVVIRRLLEHIESADGVKFSFFDCTHVVGDARGRFERYLPEKTYTKNDDKQHLIRARCEEYGAKRCLVIGHDRDDLKMLGEARRLGGVTVGFRPAPEVYPLLDAAVFAEDWRPVARLFEESFEKRG